LTSSYGFCKLTSVLFFFLFSGEEDTKEAAKQQVKLSQQATERAIKAQEAARDREKEMEERKKNLEKDLKHEHEKTTEVKIELAKAEAKAEYSEKAKQDFMKHAKVEDPERAHELEVKVGRLEGTIAGMKDPCGGKGSDCGKCSGGDCGSEPVAHNDEDAIQTAVDAAVERLINKTRERKTEGALRLTWLGLCRWVVLTCIVLFVFFFLQTML
jgi:hypothetical protein